MRACRSLNEQPRRPLPRVHGNVDADPAVAARFVGYLSAQASTAAGPARHLAAFHQGLRDSGYVDGRGDDVKARWNAL
jgi:hypothetical protein